MAKIFLNSHPRTGMTVLGNFLRLAYKRNDDPRYGEYANRENFFIWSHTPIALLASFPDIYQITIIRHPLQTVASLAAKLDSGVGIDIHDQQIRYYNPNKDIYKNIEEYIDYTLETISDEYLSYLDNTAVNINNLIPFTFEQVTNKIEYVLNFIDNEIKEECVRFTTKEIKEITDRHYDKWKLEDEMLPTSARRNPGENKSEMYFKFLKTYQTHNRYNNIIKSYNIVIDMINKKQEKNIYEL